jgi:hypothetical protein
LRRRSKHVAMSYLGGLLGYGYNQSRTIENGNR